MATGGTINATDTSFGVLEALCDDPGLNMAELADRLDTSKSTVHNHLSTLEEIGYVTRGADGYQLGLRFLQFSEAARRNYPIYRVAKQEISTLTEEVGERAQLLVEENGAGVYIFRMQTDHAVETDTQIGVSVDLHSVASGKAFLAFLSADERDRLLDRCSFAEHSPNTITDREALLEQLEEIRERGYSFNDEERKLGMRAVGAPVISDDEGVLGSISVSGPTTRLHGEWFREEIPGLVLRTARVIGVKASYP